MSFSDKVIVITGGGTGIGLATTKLLARQGAKVSICDLLQDSLDVVKSEIQKSGQHDILVTALDVRDRSAVETWIEKTVEYYGKKIDGVVNAAGVAGKNFLINSIDTITDEDFDLVWAVNVKGVLNCLRAEIPAMNDGGSIVNLASLSGLTGNPKTAAYSVSKHGIVGLSRVATKELGSRKIRVNCVCPGPTETPLLASTSEVDPTVEAMYANFAPLGRIGKASEVAELIV